MKALNFLDLHNKKQNIITALQSSNSFILLVEQSENENSVDV